MGRAKDALVAGLLLLARRRKRRLWPGQRERIVPPAPQNSGSEVLASLLLLAAAGCGVAFVVVYVLDRLPAHTQLLGLSLGLACLFVAAALVVTAKRLIVTEELEDDYPVDEHGQPYRASDIEEDTLYTAFAEGSEKEEMGSSIVLVRLPKDLLRLPSGQAGYDADGIVAYSKVCTHAGCAISLYRAPLFQPDAPRPALVCPCHYSTFDPAAGGKVTFGPAGRKLPMLPLTVAPNGELRAAGNFDEPVGPSWWGVRMKRPT